MFRFIFPLWVFLFCSIDFCFAAVPPLEREVTLSLNNESITNVFKKIQEQTNLIFSYPSAIVTNATPISVHVSKKSVREVLTLILPTNLSYKEKNNYIIIKERNTEKKPKKTELSGYVYDKQNNQKIPNVTIYDKNTLQSVTTNQYGYYSISVPPENESITIKKENYTDTVIKIAHLQTNAITNINLYPVSDSKKRRDSVKDFNHYANHLFKKFNGYINILNIKDTINRTIQVSYIPFVGTNHRLSANTSNQFSYNIIGGYSRGTRAVEIGGVFNIDRETVRGVQFAGNFNMVGDSVKGVQIAGTFNIVGRSMKGVQGAGIFNLNVGNVNGAQFAGTFNFNAKQFKGACFAGILNVNRYANQGNQFAGILNVSEKDNSGVSIAGISNMTWHSAEASQIAGLANFSRSSRNTTQVCALTNVSLKGSTKTQVSTFLNITDTVNRLQFGMLNYADTAVGVPFGICSIVRKGLHQVEVSADELFFMNLAVRTGVHPLFNIFSSSIDFRGSDPTWAVGYGLGTSIKINNKLRTEVSVINNHISRGQFNTELSEQLKCFWGIECKTLKKISVAIGPVFNMYINNPLRSPLNVGNIIPYIHFQSTSNTYNYYGWVGAKIAILL